MADGGALNVWRLQEGQLQRLTHSHTGVLAHSGTAADGSLATVVMAPQGHALHRLDRPAPLQAISSARQPMPARRRHQRQARPRGAGPGRALLGLARPAYPRAWLPAITADRGLTAYGASISGADALGWHQYAATLQWETSQKELLGTLEYVFVDSHGLALKRSLKARAWTGGSGDETTTVYDRDTKLQWLSTLPITRLQRRITLGVGAAMDRSERVDLEARAARAGTTSACWPRWPTGTPVAATGTPRGPTAACGPRCCTRPTSPLARADTPYDGSVLRADLRGYLPLGRSVLALRWTEVRASGSTEPFQLGGATDEALQLGPVLNNRELALRGYKGDEAALRGRHARVASVEWRTPLADIDRHAMVPPLGINRLSATLFADFGGAWDRAARPSKYHRGVGVELLAEAKLLYALGLQLRLGVARGLDEPRSTRGYLTLSRAFLTCRASRSGPGLAPSLDCRSQRVQHTHAVVPADAGVGDALAVGQRGRVVLAGGELLRAVVQVAFHHHAEDAAVAGGQLRAHVHHHVDLALVLLAAVGVAGVDHQLAGQLGGFDFLAGGGHAGGVVVGLLPPRRMTWQSLLPRSRRWPPGRSCAPTGSGAAARRPGWRRWRS
jgi:hypothetical protein